MSIDLIRTLIADGKYKWSDHCLERMGERDISIADVRNCIASGEIIEDYPNDYPNPSCLVFGYSLKEIVVHIVVGCDGETVYFITAYFPNTIKFESDLKTRRKS